MTYFENKYFIKTIARENKDEINIFIKWKGYSSILENPKGNLHILTIQAPINPKIRAKKWCLWSSLPKMK